MTKNEALQKALDALGPTPPDCCGCQEEWQIAIDAIKTALEAPQRTWVGLTPEDTFEIGEKLGLSDIAWVDLMHAIEAKLKEKNT